MPGLSSIVWLFLFIAFALWEGLTIALVSIWFAAGALAAMAASFFTDNIWAQIFLFALVSAVTMAVVRPMAKKYVFPRRVPTNADRVIGRQGVVTQAIDNLAAQGAVVVFGAAWTARSETGDPIPEGETVVIQRIEGVKLFVTPVQ